jgi:isochorismate hydrolase
LKQKKRRSAFYPTDLDFLLRNMDVKRVVPNGCMTDCCILNSAFDASNLGYRVTVAQDLVRGTNSDMEDAALKMISLHIGLVVESRDLVEEWRRPLKCVRRLPALERRSAQFQAHSNARFVPEFRSATLQFAGISK